MSKKNLSETRIPSGFEVKEVDHSQKIKVGKETHPFVVVSLKATDVEKPAWPRHLKLPLLRGQRVIGKKLQVRVSHENECITLHNASPATLKVMLKALQENGWPKASVENFPEDAAWSGGKNKIHLNGSKWRDATLAEVKALERRKEKLLERIEMQEKRKAAKAAAEVTKMKRSLEEKGFVVTPALD